jgi:uncharacterized protein YciI
MNRYLILLTPRRETFLQDATAEEMAVVERHFEYLQNLLAKGRLILAGRCEEGPPGIVVFEAESEEAAREVLDNDPAIEAGIFRGEVHPFRLALLRPYP